MEKKMEANLDAESMTTVNVKEYAPSEAYSAEPPPAYHRPKSVAVQVARIAAVTVVLVSFILGSFIFASAWVQANSACQDALNEQLARMDQLLEDRAALGPQYAALLGDDGDDQPAESSQSHTKREEPSQESDRRSAKKDQDQENSVDSAAPAPSSAHTPIHLKLPLQLDFDELAGALVERNQRSRMNCVVEKRRAEEVVDHQPRTVRLPFGLNLTTDPRYEHVSGERMAIFCESGHDQRHVPMEPTPQSPTQEPSQHHVQRVVAIPIQDVQGDMYNRAQKSREQQQEEIVQYILHQQRMIQQQQMEQQMAQQQQEQNYEAQPQQLQQVVPMYHPGQQQQQQQGVPMEFRGGMRPVPVQAAMTVEVEGRDPIEVEGRALNPQQLQNLHLQRLRQLHEQVVPVEVIEARAFQHPEQQPQPQQQQGPQAPMPADTLRPPFPWNQVQFEPNQNPGQQQTLAQAIEAEEARPHYVQPRSVRSVDNVFHHREKRVRRCACDCSC